MALMRTTGPLQNQQLAMSALGAKKLGAGPVSAGMAPPKPGAPPVGPLGGTKGSPFVGPLGPGPAAQGGGPQPHSTNPMGALLGSLGYQNAQGSSAAQQTADVVANAQARAKADRQVGVIVPTQSAGPGGQAPGTGRAGGATTGSGPSVTGTQGAAFQQQQTEAATAAADAEAGKSDIDKLYEQMIARAGDQWKITEDLNLQSMAMMQRKSAAMQGSMGRSVAGGFAGAMGGAYIGGMNQMNQARAQHEQALNALQMGMLKNKQSQQYHEDEMAGQMDAMSQVAEIKSGMSAEEWQALWNDYVAGGGNIEGSSNGLPGDPETAAALLAFLNAQGKA